MSTLPAKGYRATGIDTAIPWPNKEVVLDFRGRKFHLLPETDTLSRMIRAETDHGFTILDADKLILELLSALAWAEQAKAMTTIGSWSTTPPNIGKAGNAGMGLTGNGHFDYLPNPSDPKAKLALALYREGLSVNFVPYQFLGFFKIINIIRHNGPTQIQWIKDSAAKPQKRRARFASLDG